MWDNTDLKYSRFETFNAMAFSVEPLLGWIIVKSIFGRQEILIAT